MTEPLPTAHQSPPAPPLPVAPPTRPGQLGAQPRMWHQVIGVISIVLGILGTLSNLWQAVGAFLAPYVMKSFSIFLGAAGAPQQAQSQQSAMAEAMTMVALPTAIFGGLACVASVILIIAGVRSVQRDTRTARLHSLYAALRVVAGIGLLVTALVMQPAMNAQIAAGPGGIPAGMQSLMKIMQVVGAIIATLVTCAYPVFLFIWFRRASVRSDMAAWPRRA